MMSLETGNQTSPQTKSGPYNIFPGFVLQQDSDKRRCHMESIFLETPGRTNLGTEFFSHRFNTMKYKVCLRHKPALLWGSIRGDKVPWFPHHFSYSLNGPLGAWVRSSFLRHSEGSFDTFLMGTTLKKRSPEELAVKSILSSPCIVLVP